MIPGSNLLASAMRLIKPTQIGYLKAIGRTQNAARQWIPQFGDPVHIRASVQAVNMNKYAALGLDFQKKYIKIFVERDVVSVERDSSGDRFTFSGRLYQMNNDTNWFHIDGWSTCIAVDIGPATGN